MATESYAVEARDFVSFNRHATLCTISKGYKGYPFGSLVLYDVTSRGELIIYISLIAEHYKNLMVDPRASVCITDPFGTCDPQAHPRATILTRFTVVAPNERAEVQKSYEQRFPNSINYEIAHNFVFMRGAPERIRWIGGFGEIGWVEADEFAAVTPDLLAYEGMGIVEHMNYDHQDALKDLARAYASFDAAPYFVEMVGINEEGFTLSLKKGGDSQTLEIQFPKMVTGIDEVRRVIIELLRDARKKIAQQS
jgi:heme iron utilization protein